MPIDFTFSPDVDKARELIRSFIEDEVESTTRRLTEEHADSGVWRTALHALRDSARANGVWLPHMPTEWGGMGLGPTALAAVSAELARTTWGPYVVNCYAPDEGNMHTLMHWGTPEQKERYLRPLCEGTSRSCFAMTEPEVAGSDPTLMATRAVLENDEWVINGHKWFISGARGARFAILLARTEDDPEVPQAATSAFLVDIPSEGWEMVRDIETMSGSHNHCEIRITDLRVPATNMLGDRGGVTGSASTGSVRPALLIACVGSARSRLLST
jgi:acyl-CoA dehydrogenase